MPQTYSYSHLNVRVGALYDDGDKKVHNLAGHPRGYVVESALPGVFVAINDQHWVRNRTTAGGGCTPVVYFGKKPAPSAVQKRHHAERRQMQSAIRASLRQNHAQPRIRRAPMAPRPAPAVAPPPPAAPHPPSVQETAPADVAPSTAPTCVVCMDETLKCNVALIPCMHMCACQACAPSIRGMCPICRVPITQKRVVYY